MSTRALLLVDVQADYLDAANLAPSAETLLSRIAELRGVCRELDIPVIHAHTRVRPDGADRMPHLRERDIWWCVAGSPGAIAPPEAAPAAGEAVFYKNVFNAMADGTLDRHLRSAGIDELVVAGLHLHACVRETALAAYQAGYRVSIAADAVASYDLLHAELTRDYLRTRGIAFAPGRQLLATGHSVSPSAKGAPRIVSACIDGEWHDAAGEPTWQRRNPACWSQVIDDIAAATVEQIDDAAALAATAQRAWARRSPDERRERLSAFIDALAARRETLVSAIVGEVAKPLRDADAEVDRALELAQLALQYFGGPPAWDDCGTGVHARRVPTGTVAAITPFNHPLAIAIGKLMPALTLGNAVLWKPSLAAASTTRCVMDAAAAADLPRGLLAVLHGDGQTALRLARHAAVNAVSVTASSAAGRQLALACAQHFKPLQAELGGNNAVVVSAQADVDVIAAEIARSAFGFAGQRCTAGRRILVETTRLGALADALVREIRALRVGLPALAETDVGPLISRAKQAEVEALVDAARTQGATILCGGTRHADDDLAPDGCWYAPTLVTGVAPSSAIWQQETFGPVAVLHGFDGIDDAIALVNGVSQGLIATLYGGSASERQRFLDGVQVGVVKFDQAPAGAHAEAPFGGWKDSGFGPPEHGRWDEAFYTRTQAVYDY